MIIILLAINIDIFYLKWLIRFRVSCRCFSFFNYYHGKQRIFVILFLNESFIKLKKPKKYLLCVHLCFETHDAPFWVVLDFILLSLDISCYDFLWVQKIRMGYTEIIELLKNICHWYPEHCFVFLNLRRCAQLLLSFLCPEIIIPAPIACPLITFTIFTPRISAKQK